MVSSDRRLDLDTGEQFDPDLGFYYLRTRYSNPETGRFWTMDDFAGRQEDPRSLHKYLYAYCNPVNVTDPSGLNGDLNSLQTAIGELTGIAARYISGIPTAARVAFGAGGATLGAFFNQFGAVVQRYGDQIIEMMPTIIRLEPILQGFSRRPDWLLRVGNTIRLIEGKYQLPRAGEALTRLGSQLQQFTQWASQGAGREVVVWALKSPDRIAEAEQTVLQAAGNPQAVRFVYGIEGFFDYLYQFAP